jgi:uncharacterized protein YjiS (DUF1127 family)
MDSLHMPAPAPLRLIERGRRQAALLKAAALAAWSLRLGQTLLLWLERYRQRRALGSLSDHMLKDLGMSRADAGQETGKRFWES